MQSWADVGGQLLGSIGSINDIHIINADTGKLLAEVDSRLVLVVQSVVLSVVSVGMVTLADSKQLLHFVRSRNLIAT